MRVNACACTRLRAHAWQAVLDLSGALSADRVGGIFQVCRSNNFDAVAELAQARLALLFHSRSKPRVDVQGHVHVQDLLAEGFPVSQIVAQMLEFCLGPDSGLANIAKAKLACAFAEARKWACSCLCTCASALEHETRT